MSATAPRSQRRSALDTANEKKAEMTRLRRELKQLPTLRARERAAELIIECSDAVGAFDLYEFLTAIPRFGPIMARFVCETEKVWPLARVENLTRGERSRIADRILYGGWEK